MKTNNQINANPATVEAYAAAVLLPYIEAYNNAARLLNLPKLPLYELSIKSLADNGAEHAAKR